MKNVFLFITDKLTCSLSFVALYLIPIKPPKEQKTLKVVYIRSFS